MSDMLMLEFDHKERTFKVRKETVKMRAWPSNCYGGRIHNVLFLWGRWVSCSRTSGWNI